ncbi:MAG: hypothetical protein DRI36_06025 [Caldiserica bacterium]|nr:MAG: hypothetical protein DRI36_06025 [Caldisericota bacterium]
MVVPDLNKKLNLIIREIDEFISKFEERKKDIKKLKELQSKEYEVLQEIQKEIGKRKPEMKSLNPLKIKEIQKILNTEVVLDYLLTYKSLIIFYITKNDFDFIQINKKEEFFKEIHSLLLETLSSPNQKGIRWYLSEISKYFIPEKLKRKLKDNSTLIIIPFSFLHHFPFSLLTIENNTHLCMRYPLFYMDNIQQIRKSEKFKIDNILIVSDPKNDLPYSKEEARKISSIFKKKKLLSGKNARKEKILSILDKYKNFHYAGHIVSEINKPFSTYLLLSNGILRTEEIMNLDLKLQLVFLNGCKSGKGRLLPGDEINSLPRAFHFSGAKEIIVNLWEISDSLTPELTSSFYKNLKNELSTEKSLQKVQKDAIKNKLSPFYWAGFKIIK